MSAGAEIFIRLHGRFRVTDAKGNILTPRSAKAQGILALVMSNTDFERGRFWLQDKLWSDRPQKQGADSYRQALRDIRRCFGELADVLHADRQVVRLDSARVALDASSDSENEEFLEGIDIKDPEFDLWLVEQRAKYLPKEVLADVGYITAIPNRRNSVLFLNETDKPGMCQMLENQFIDAVSRSVQEEVNVDVLRRLPATAQPGVLVASVQAFEDDAKRVGLRATIEDVDGNRVIWSEMEIVRPRGAPVISEMRILALVHRMSMSLKWALTQVRPAQSHSTDANLLALMAVRKIFSLRYDELQEAEKMLQSAFEIEKRGVYQSWLAQLYTIQLVERACSLEDIAHKSDAACALALELEPDNSNVLASVADASLAVKRNFLRSAELARMSVDANSANPLAWWTMAAGHMYLENQDAAYKAAINAQTLAGATRLRFWADIQRGLAALVKGRTVEGLRNLEASSALSPDFRAPLRYRTAIYSASGLTGMAMDSASALTVLEPDFSFDRLANDPDYPVSLMRKHGMLDTVRLA